MLLGRITLYTLLLIAAISALVIASRDVYLPLIGTVFEGASRADTDAVTAEAWGIFDPENGRIISGTNIDEVRPIASISKLFTAHAAYHSTRLQTLTRITWGDLDTYGRAGKLRHGSELTVYELLFPLLIESSNDAGAAIARVLGPDLSEANATVRELLGLTETRIVEPTGLSAANVSTVRELARTFAHVRDRSPHTIDITRLSQYLNGAYGWVNVNPVQKDPRFRGGKHGYTDEAGKTLVAQFDVGRGGEEEIIGIVLLGSDDLTADVETLLRAARR